MKRGKILVVDDNQGIRSALKILLPAHFAEVEIIASPKSQKRVSGYRPQLDSIHIYHRTEYITKEIKMVTKPKRWGLGLQAGYGIALHKGQIHPAPYIGVGLSYSLINW